MDLNKKHKATELRKEGKSYKEIILATGVSKSTLSKWVKDIPLTDEQKALLKGRMKSRYEGAKANQLKAQERRDNIIKSAQIEANKLVNNPLFVAGLMLYWAEGTKGGSTVTFTNSNPEMIKLMMRWFREICLVPENKFRILIFIHSLIIDNNWQEKWVGITGVPSSQFTRPYVKPTVTKHRKNILYEGTCAVKINDAALHAKIKGWQIGFLEFLQK